MRVLIAEDEPTSRRLLEIWLGKWGYDVVVTTDGDSALAELSAPVAPKLAILDWEIPEMEGIEVCRRVRELPQGKLTYVIILTGRGRKEDVVEGLEAGASDYVTKPCDPEELRARVRVGERVVDLQGRLVEAERNRVLTQAAGAAAHEINQPLTVMIGTADLLLMGLDSDSPHRRSAETLRREAFRISDIVQKMARIRQYATKPYLEGIDIIDLNAASEQPTGNGNP